MDQDFKSHSNSNLSGFRTHNIYTTTGYFEKCKVLKLGSKYYPIDCVDQ